MTILTLGSILFTFGVCISKLSIDYRLKEVIGTDSILLTHNPMAPVNNYNYRALSEEGVAIMSNTL